MVGPEEEAADLREHSFLVLDEDLGSGHKWLRGHLPGSITRHIHT